MDEQPSIGRLIKKRRRALDLTQEDLAKRVGYSVITIRKVESDERRPSRQLAELLARHLEFTADEQQAFVGLARLDRDEPSPYRPQRVEENAILGRRSVPTNLSNPLTRLIGRTSEVATARDLLLEPGTRLTTLVGPPGIGKSRLSVEVAREVLRAFDDGVYVVPLARLNDVNLIAPTIAKAVGAKEVTASSAVESLISYLHGRRLLLVLDNFEHLLAAAPMVAEMLAACPEARVLATSRAPLHLRGERLLVVPPLALPTPAGDMTAAAVSGYSSVELFVERARAADPDFALTDGHARDIAAICAGVDGLPLSIELVAARVRLLAPHVLLERLTSSLALLSDGPRDLPPRQQTLRAALDWSYDLLDPAGQALLARLAVFAGGCTLPAAEEVVGVDADLPATVFDGLAGLTDNNLLQQEERAGGERYFVFLETIRAYALERLRARGEEAEVRERYAAYYMKLATSAGQLLTSGEQESCLERLDAEHPNLRAVLNHFISHREVGQALRLCATLWRFWHIRSYQTEARRSLERVLEMEGPADPEDRARTLYGAGWIALDRHDSKQARAYFDESLALFRSLGCGSGIAEALHGAATMAQAEGDHEDAAELLYESLSLYRELEDDEGIAWSLDHLGMGALGLAEYGRAHSLFERSLAIFRRLHHAWGTAILLHHVGLASLAGKRYEPAADCFRSSLVIFRDLSNNWGVATSLTHLGYVYLAELDYRSAATQFVQALEVTRADEDREGIARSLLGLMSLAVQEGKLNRAAYLLGAVEAVIEGGRAMNPVERASYRRNVAAVGERVGSEPVAAALSRGRAMPLSMVVADILS